MAAIYIRVSTQEQSEHHGLDGQLASCRAYCAKQGYRVARILQDVESGTDMERPGLLRLISLAGRGAFDVVVVWKRDRFARDAVGAGFFEAHLKRQHVRLESVQVGPQDDTPTTRFLNRIMDAASELEHSMITERFMLGRRTAASKGQYPHKPPYGYKLHQGRLIIEPAEAVQIRDLFAACLAGLTIRTITTTTGMSKSCLVGRLANPAYKGEARYAGIAVPCPPIVTPELWEEARRRLAYRAHNPFDKQRGPKRP